MCDYSLHLVASRPAKVGAWAIELNKMTCIAHNSVGAA
jgi:hypothetical protein